MRVILDVDAIRPPLNGIGRYALALARGLQKSDQVEDVRFFSYGRWIDDVEDLAKEHTISLLRRGVPFRRLARWGYRHVSEWRFRRQANHFAKYVYHSPSYRLMPFSGMSVVTVHDLSFIRHPEFHPRERALHWQRELVDVVARAGHLVTDSEFSRREIIELLNVDADFVSAVHLGVDPTFQPYAKEACVDVMARYRLRHKGYSLVVATIEPRKNFVRLLQAFELLPVETRRAFPLAIAGDKGWLSEAVHAAFARLAEKGEAMRLGYVAEEDLPILYAAAAMFVYPSLYEGFGLPVLESMACGTAVLTSNAGAMLEVAGDACLLADPYSPVAIADGWRVLLSDNAKRTALEEAGLRRARLFSWNQCVDRTIDVYARLPLLR